MAFNKDGFKERFKDGISVAKEKLDIAADVVKEKAKDGSYFLG